MRRFGPKTKVLLAGMTALLVSLGLGAFSVQPFTKLFLPWMMFSQWLRVNYPAENDILCLQRLRGLPAEFNAVELPADQISQGCVIDTPVSVTNLQLTLRNIAWNPAIEEVGMSCVFAERLHSFIISHLIPDVQEHFGVLPVAFLHKGGYSCRGQRDYAEIKSEHAFGEAMDFAGVELADGRQILVKESYFDEGEAGRFLRKIARAACNHFGTNLGPEYNQLHADHFHWSTGFPRVCR